MLSEIIKAVSNFNLELRTAQDSRFPEKRAISRRRVTHAKRFVLEPEYPRREVEAHLSQYFPLLKPTPDHVVLDFGASEGWFSYALGRLGARVVGFEPNFDAFGIARERCEKMRGVTIVNAAVGPQSGLTELYFPPDYPLALEIFSGSASTMPTNVEVDTSSGVSVFQIGVEEILDAFPHIYFLKIDIEGCEQELWSSFMREFKQD